MQWLNLLLGEKVTIDEELTVSVVSRFTSSSLHQSPNRCIFTERKLRLRGGGGGGGGGGKSRFVPPPPPPLLMTNNRLPGQHQRGER